ncbi:LysR substrate-binding domain-containing protein [Pelomonas sp. Root1237]|uniref:LysR substrate-binding domain-containing protein n=1 Tax=Pelomonas sp. Root1237 TaxID=1736434 RepID=UPI0006FFE447|nr:LysR substrate-binding domain-containing protein [Pelomonas sp. Root1237]KQV87448.1 LysR family transcriptional regulator [Pelomonas sp. Root1237]
MLIDPQLLRSFVSVADLGSVSRAAERVRLTQSAVSAQIKRLEAQLGCRVFARTTRSLRLTAQGEVLLGYARGILTLNDHAVLHLGAARRIRDTVRIGCSEGLPADWLFAALTRFREKYPEVELEVTGGISIALSELTRRRALDISIGGRCGGSGVGELLWSEPLVWAFSERSFLNPARPVPMAFLSEPCPYRDAALVALAGHRRRWHIALTAQSSGALLAAVASGFAVTPLTPSLMATGLRAVPTGDILPDLPRAEFTMQLREGRLGEAATEVAADIRHACHRWLGSLQLRPGFV